MKCMQEVVCGCSGKPTKENSRSCRCECPAMGVRVSKCTCLSGITSVSSLLGMQKRAMKKNGIKRAVWWLSVTCRKRGMQARSIHEQCSNSLGSCCTKRTHTGSKSWKRVSWATHTHRQRSTRSGQGLFMSANTGKWQKIRV